MILNLLSFLYLFQPPNPMPVGVPQLQLQNGDTNPSSIRQLDYQIEVLGFLTQTTITLEITDPDPFRQEASFLLQLPPHSLVDGFQLGIGGTMVDGVIQEKNLARIGFDREKRKRVDPGLIEWVGHNLYRVRVFPIQAERPRKIALRFMAPLSNQEEGDTYSLDLSGIDPKTEVTVAMLQRDGAAPPQVSGTKNTAFSQAENGFRWQMSTTGPLRHRLEYQWPTGQRAAIMVAEADDGWHFALRSKSTEKRGALRARPDTVAVFWDASNARNTIAKRQESEALLRLISFRNPSSIALIPFRDRQEQPMTFPNTKLGKGQLEKVLSTMVYDGGTNLHGLALPENLRVDEVWLFTDGQDTLGLPSQPWPGSLPVYAFSASAQAQWPYLEHFCEARGGKGLFWQAPSEEKLHRLFLQSESQPDTLSAQPGALLASEITYASATETLLAAGEVSGRPDGFFLGHGSNQQKVLGTMVDLTQHGDVVPWLARFAVGRRLETLQREADNHREAILDLGDAHGLVTPHTSLIVFETLDQYAANGLVPPANAPFDASQMPDMAPSKEALADLKADYFERASGKWANYNAITQKEILKLFPFAPDIPRDAWMVMERVPGIQADSWQVSTDTAQAGTNIGGNEVHHETSNQENFVSLSPEGASAGHLDFSEFDLAEANVENMIVTTETPAEEMVATSSAQVLSAQESPDESGNSDEMIGPSLLDWQQVHTAVEQVGASAQNPYEKYLSLKAEYGGSPSFYYQVAHHFSEIGQPELARRIATNLLEQGWQDDRLLFAAGMLCHVLEDFELAEVLYHKLAQNRPEWPQPRMLVAQTLRERAIGLEKSDQKTAIQYYRQSFDLYQKLALEPWGSLDEWDQADFLKENRFPYILINVVEEAFWIQKRLATLGEKVRMVLPPHFEAGPEDIKADLRVVFWWDDENVDLGLCVEEPGKVFVDYTTSLHASDGRIVDQVLGLGPDLYHCRTGFPGTFKFKVRFFSRIFSRLLGPTYTKTEFWTRYGYPDEAYKVGLNRITMETNNIHQLGEVAWPPDESN